MSRLQERIENFNRAYNLFAMARNEYINNRTNDMNKLALIQGFEIITELGWKTMKDYLHLKGIDVFTPKDTIKEAFAINFLPTAQIWIDMVKDRNASSQEYNMDKVALMLEKISTSYYDEITRYKEQVGFINE